MFNRLRSSFDMNSPVDKTKLINVMFELILSVNNVLACDGGADKGFP